MTYLEITQLLDSINAVRLFGWRICSVWGLFGVTMVSPEYLARSSLADQLWLVEFGPLAKSPPCRCRVGSFGDSIGGAQT